MRLDTDPQEAQTEEWGPVLLLEPLAGLLLDLACHLRCAARTPRNV